jgi:hypothetical protein
MLQYRKSYKHIAEVMSHKEYGPPVCNKLARAMNEEIAPPLHATLDASHEEEDEDEVEDESPESMEMQDDEIDPSMEDDFDPNMQDDEMQGEPNMPQPQGSALSAAMQNFRKALRKF